MKKLTTPQWVKVLAHRGVPRPPEIDRKKSVATKRERDAAAAAVEARVQAAYRAGQQDERKACSELCRSMAKGNRDDFDGDTCSPFEVSDYLLMAANAIDARPNSAKGTP